MDDLAGLNWSNSTSSPSKQPNPPASSNVNYYPTLKPTPPTSGRSTPALQGKHPVGSTGPSKSGTPANDSFANLVPFGSSQPAKQVSLQEQQRALQEQRAKSLGFQNSQWTGGSTGSARGSGHSTPARTASPALPVTSTGGRNASNTNVSSTGFGLPKPPQSGTKDTSEEDILAAFNASAPVDRSSHFPPPTSRSASTGPPAVATDQNYAGLDDDDPFGLGMTVSKPAKSPAPAEEGADEDDVLGLLGKPVSEIPRQQKSPEPRAEKRQDPQDKALAELVDMGFPAEKAAKALDTAGGGTDVQAAVGWLLNQAHAESSGKSNRATSREHAKASRTAEGESDPSAPAWMRQGGPSSGRGQTNGDDREAAKTASELGNNLFKTANSLWKSGQKRFNKAVAEFNADSDPSQPKWMRETQPEDQPRRTKRQDSAQDQPRDRPPTKQGLVDMTDEAMMLEAGSSQPPLRTKARAKAEPRQAPSRPTTQSPASSREQIPTLPTRPGRRFVEDESAQAYVSPARRKKPAPKPQPPEEPDLLFGGSEPASKPTTTSKLSAAPTPPRTQAAPSRPKAPAAAPRPKAPPRNIPSMSSIALQSSTSHRVKGNEAFKLGNYGEATTSYTNSLRDIPDKHPLAILLLTNRALTNLKTGDPKAAIADAEAAVAIIGPSRGQDETINIGGDEGSKPMGPFWGKAMMRRAEALEQLERWADAAKAWGECVQAGVGGSQAIQARTRCERALAPKPAAAPRPKAPPKKPAPRPAARSAMDDLSGRPAAAAPSAEAVTRLRAANAAAEKADDEKFALADSVDARLTQWRNGKEGNLRALLGSLDTVLWAGANWKKVGMSELIVPGKVKVAYMKGIAKVHPDKLPPGASTEQVMISSAVFATLNEAWDRFKAENGL